MSRDPTGVGARWAIMIVSLGVTASSFLFINGVAFLIPRLENARGTPLSHAGLLASMPSWGLVVTMFAWGYLLDHVGERMVMAVGSALTAAAAYAAASVHSLLWIGVFLFLGGMAAGGCNSAGGRLVSGWFPPQQRGLAMGIRQTAQPLGIASGALVIPELAERGVHAGLMFPAVVCTLAAVASVLGIVDPPRKSRTKASEQELASPYRGSSILWRIHAASALLMMPQTVTVTFMLVWLINHHGWSVAQAGVLVTISHLLVSALGREFSRIDAKTDRSAVAGATPFQRLNFMVGKLNRAMQRNPLLTEAMTRAYVFADASAASEVDQVEKLIDSMFARAMANGEPTEDQYHIARVISDVWLSNLLAWLTRRASATDVSKRLDLAVRLLIGDQDSA